MKDNELFLAWRRVTSADAFSRLQVFGFLLGIDLKGMSGPGDENDGEQMRDVPRPSSAGGTQTYTNVEEVEEEEVSLCSFFSIGLPLVLMSHHLLGLFRLQNVENGLFCARLCLCRHH